MTRDGAEKPDAPKVSQASEIPEREIDYASPDQQNAWKNATGAYRASQKNSAALELLNGNDAAQNFEITGLNDTKSARERTQLIAQAGAEQGARTNEIYAPMGSDGRWHFQNPRLQPGQDVAGALKEWLWNDAAHVPGDMAKAIGNTIWNGTVTAAESTNRHFATNTIPEGAAMDNLSGIVKNPEKYEQYYRQIDPEACRGAQRAFGLDKLGIDSNLIPAIMLNEQLHLKPTDDLQNAQAALGLHLNAAESIGPAQMQKQNIERLAKEYPMLQAFGDPLKAALRADVAPYFVAAYLADEVRAINHYNNAHPEQKQIPVNTDTLAYRYNPDVFRDNQGHLRSLEPWEKLAKRIQPIDAIHVSFPTDGVTGHSHHVSKVHQAMQEIKRTGL